MSCNWNELILKAFASINWRASLVPAAAVIPAPIAYIKVVAVKKLVVGILLWKTGPSFGRVLSCSYSIFLGSQIVLDCMVWNSGHLL